MNRLWSLLFFAVPILGVVAYGLAATGKGPLADAWLPPSYSRAGDTIDHLFLIIHYISAVIFVGTGVAIGWFLWRYNTRRQERAAYVTHNARLEIVWSVIPGLILVFIALYQMNSWAENKMNRPTIELNGQTVPQPPTAMVKARQFGWEFHYPGSDGKLETIDDIYIENELVLPADTEIVLQLESRDVIHSFFVPRLRLKQDIVPGMKQFVWFRVRQPAEMEVACAELCGWGHSQMKARIRVVPAAEYQSWLKQRADELAPPVRSEEATTDGAANAGGAQR